MENPRPVMGRIEELETASEAWRGDTLGNPIVVGSQQTRAGSVFPPAIDRNR